MGLDAFLDDGIGFLALGHPLEKGDATRRFRLAFFKRKGDKLHHGILFSAENGCNLAGIFDSVCRKHGNFISNTGAKRNRKMKSIVAEKRDLFGKGIFGKRGFGR